MNEPLYKNSPSHYALSLLAWLYIQLAGKTSRIKIQGRTHYPEAVIYTLWHRQQAPLVYIHRGQGVCALVSKSRDGEYMARVLGRLGFASVRGSTTSGGFMSLRGLIKALRGGSSLAITPDGPRGPSFKVQPGIIYLAQKTGAPIIPAACALSRRITLGSWDKYQLPLPFGRMAAIYGEPFRVSGSDDVQARSRELELILNNLTAEAESLVKGGK